MLENKFLIFYISIFFLISCAGSSITSIAGNAAISEKGLSKSVSDAIILAKIKSKLTSLKFKNIIDISVNVSDGKVLLVGTTHDNKKRLEIIKTIWGIKDVKRIYNEILVNEIYTLNDKLSDLYLETKVKSSLLFKSSIYSNNFSIKVFKKTLYIIGLARNIDEKMKLENYLKDYKEFKKIKSFINFSR